MENNQNSNDNNLIMFILVIVCVISMTVMFTGYNQRKDCVKVTATISQVIKGRDADGDEDYDAYVDYVYKGKKYTDVHLSYYSLSMREGKKIKIYIDPNNPTSISGANYLMLFGGFFLAIALVGFYAMNQNVIHKK